MECKGGYILPPSRTVVCINRNIMECKDVARLYGAEKDLVLIETLWNVKLQFAVNILD